MANRMWRITAAFLFLLLISACAQKHYRFEYNNTQPEKIWPQPPESPRYQFVGFITGESNFVEEESSRTFFKKSISWLSGLVFGAEKPQMLFRPQGVYLDDNEQRLYVTDIGAKAVFVFDLRQNRLQRWEQIDEHGKFASPIAVIKNNKAEVYISDSLLGFVAKFDADGKLLAKLGDKILRRPTGLAYDKDNARLYVADAKQHRIVVFSDEGKQVFDIGGKKGESEGLFNSPTYISIDNGKLYVSDTLNARIQVFDLHGRWLQSFGERGMFVGNLPRPKGVATDSENHIYVVESYYGHLLIYSDKGEPLLPIGGNGKQAGEFDLPAGIWIDKNDTIYIADMFNSRISVFQYLKH